MTTEPIHACALPEPDEDRQTFNCPVCGRHWYVYLEWGHVYNQDGTEFKPEPEVPIHLRHLPYDR